MHCLSDIKREIKKPQFNLKEHKNYVYINQALINLYMGVRKYFLWIITLLIGFALLFSAYIFPNPESIAQANLSGSEKNPAG